MEYYVSLEFLLTSLKSNRCLIHFTIADTNSKKIYGERNLAVFYWNSKLQINLALNGNVNYWYNHNEALSSNRWYRLEIEQVFKEGKVVKLKMKT